MSEKCPHCGFAPPKTYKYHLDDLNISTLLKLWNYSLKNKTYKINVKDVDLTQGERLRMTQLRFHALIAKVKEDGKQKPNMWLITRRGSQFLKGNISIPAYVYTRANTIIGHAEEQLHKRDFKILSNFEPTYEVVPLGI